jgi:hypothetical protein
MAERLSVIQGIKITLNALADEFQVRASGISRLRWPNWKLPSKNGHFSGKIVFRTRLTFPNTHCSSNCKILLVLPSKWSNMPKARLSSQINHPGTGSMSSSGQGCIEHLPKVGANNSEHRTGLFLGRSCCGPYHLGVTFHFLGWVYGHFMEGWNHVKSSLICEKWHGWGHPKTCLRTGQVNLDQHNS